MQELTITIPGFNIQAQTWGSSHAPHKIIAMHGWLDNSGSFNLLAPLINNAYIVAIDLPGHGLSDHKPPHCFYHFLDYVADCLAVADALNWDRFDLLGHSLGGAVATLVAATFPERVKQLALIDAIGGLTTPAELTPEKLRESIIDQAVIANKPKRYYSDMQAALKLRIKRNQLSEDAALTLCKRNLTYQEDQGYYWHFDQRLLYPSRMRLTEAQMQAFLQAIVAPTCVIHAIPGFGFDQDKFAKACRYVQNLTYHKIIGNHYPHLEQPELVATILNDFFE